MRKLFLFAVLASIMFLSCNTDDDLSDMPETKLSTFDAPAGNGVTPCPTCPVIMTQAQLTTAFVNYTLPVTTRCIVGQMGVGYGHSVQVFNGRTYMLSWRPKSDFEDMANVPGYDCITCIRPNEVKIGNSYYLLIEVSANTQC